MIRSWAPGCGRSTRAITRIPAGQDARFNKPVSSATQAPSRTSPSASSAGDHAVSGIFASSSAVCSGSPNPTEYDSRRAVSQSSSSWVEPAPSTRISTERPERWPAWLSAGSCLSAWRITVMWSVAVFEPAFPLRSSIATGSPVTAWP